MARETSQVDDLLLRLVSDLSQVKSQQSEINRRIGKIEEKIDEDLVSPKDFERLEEQLEALSQTSYSQYFYQAIYWAIGITLVTIIGRYFGVEIFS